MQTSQSISKIAAALLSAQKEITYAIKDSVNPHFKSRYADLGSVIEAVKPALNEHGISFIQLPAPSDPGTLALCTRLLHESGEWIESVAITPLSKADPQGYGSAITYLRRYSLAAAVGLYQDDDDGNAASATPPREVVQPLKQRRNGVVADILATSEPLSKDEERELDELTAELITLFRSKGCGAACDLLAGKNLELMQLMYLWNQTPSDIRNPMKAEGARRRELTAKRAQVPA